MQQKVNYITHLNCAFETIVNDEKLSPFHISLYFCLFQYWNISKFRTPISINREEMMRSSKIGSANTYTKCLKELHTWGYIKYEPSHSPLVGSKIYLYTFNKTPDKTINNAIDISANKSTHKTTEKALRPSINSLNKTNKLNSKNKYEHTRTKNHRKSFVVDSEQAKAKKQQVAPTQREVENYFAQQKSSGIEAKKFFNHYQSNGWLVGKVSMKDWQASAEKWILNTDKFSNKNPQAKNLHVSNNKNYAEPL